MAHLPTPSMFARSGSNLEHADAFGAQLTRDVALRMKPRERARRALHARRNALISKAAARTAAAIIADRRRGFDQAFLDAKGDRDRITRAKDEMRRSMARALSKHVPGYTAYRAAQKAYLAGLRASRTSAVAGPLHQDLDVGLGDLVLSADVDYQEFGAPYELFSQELWMDPLAFDGSYADPHAGLMVQDTRFEHLENDWSLYNPTRLTYAVSVVGINYVVPRTGRLSCAAVLQNRFNQITSSVTDNFGLSYAETRAEHAIQLRVVRSGEWTLSYRDLVVAGVVSFGREFSFTQSDIQTTTPYTLSFTTADVFLKGERLQILAGPHIWIDSDVDDMSVRVDSALIWQLKMLRVGMQD